MFAEDVQRAAELAATYPRLSAHDLVHVAVMERAGATAIVTADSAFDNLAGIERLDPADAAAWLPRFEDGD
jgi:predicted nucleic acid-binding protein